MRTGIGVDCVLKGRAVVYPVVGVGREIEPKVGEVILLLSADGCAGLEVESVALVEDLGVLEDVDVAVQRLALEVCSGSLERGKDVAEARCRAKVVDEVCLHLVEGRAIANLDPAADVLLENLGHYARDVCTPVFGGVVLHRLGETAIAQIRVELVNKICGYALAEKCLHAHKLIERERKHFEFKIAPGQLRDKLAAQEIRVGAGYEDGVPSFFAEGVDDFLESPDVLDFVNEEIGSSRIGCLGIDELLKSISRFDASVGSAVEVKVDYVVIVNASVANLVGNGCHQAGFAAASDAGNNLYDVGIIIKAANLAKVYFSFVEFHGVEYSISAASLQVKGVNFAKIAKPSPLTAVFAWLKRAGPFCICFTV